MVKKKYEVCSNGEEIFLLPTQVWHYADCEKLMGFINTTIYMHYRAWRYSSEEFRKLRVIRRIKVIVVTEGI